MYRNILVPIAVDHGHNSAEAINIAEKLKTEDGRITVLSVVEQVPPYISQYLPKGQIEKNMKDAEIALKADLGGVKGVSVDVISGFAGAAIVDYAVEMEVDLIVVASHRPGLQDYFLGSTAARVVRHAPCSVHVVR